MAKPITSTLSKLQGGAFNHACGDLLAKMILAVEETGRAGKLTITIDVKKSGPAVEVTSRVTDKTPEPTPDADVYWATVEGNLTEQNPAQQKMDLQPVQTPQRNIVG